MSGDLRQGAFDALKAVPWRVKIREFVRWMLSVRIHIHCAVVVVFWCFLVMRLWLNVSTSVQGCDTCVFNCFF